MGLMIVGMVVGAYAMQGAKPASDPAASSYLSVNEESFPTVLARMRAGKAESRNVSKSYSRHATT